MKDQDLAAKLATAKGELFELPSGAIAEQIEKFKGKHTRVASSMMAGDQSKYIPSIVTQLFKLNGERLTLHDFDELDGQDAMELTGRALGANFQQSELVK